MVVTILSLTADQDTSVTDAAISNLKAIAERAELKFLSVMITNGILYVSGYSFYFYYRCEITLTALVLFCSGSAVHRGSGRFEFFPATKK